MKPGIVFILLMALSSGSTFAQTKTSNDDKKSSTRQEMSDATVSDEQKQIDASRLQIMEKLSSGVTGFVQDEKGKAKLQKLPKPVLRFNDPSRAFQDGTVWVWGEKGRPQGLLAIERYNSGNWFVECVSMTTRPEQQISADLPYGLRWSPRKPGLVFQQIPEHAAPGSKKFKRLQQLKAIARRFRFRETYRGQDSELRLMARPIQRYSDTDIIDGALFVFSNGTNPEAVLVVECVKSTTGHQWQFGVVRLSSAILEGWLDRKQVYKSPQQLINAVAEPYFASGVREERLKSIVTP